MGEALKLGGGFGKRRSDAHDFPLEIRGDLGERTLQVADVDVLVDADVVDGVTGELGVVAARRVAEDFGCPGEGVVGEQLDDEDLHHRPNEQLQLGGDVVAHPVEHPADAFGVQVVDAGAQSLGGAAAVREHDGGAVRLHQVQHQCPDGTAVIAQEDLEERGDLVIAGTPGTQPPTQLRPDLGDQQPLEGTVHVLVGGIGAQVAGGVPLPQRVQPGDQAVEVRIGEQAGGVQDACVRT